MNWIEWTKLEELIGLNDLPEFHRKFLQHHHEDASAIPLRRVQQNVHRELNKLILAGRAKRDGEKIFLLAEDLPSIDVELLAQLQQ